ncbi:hypothetical protein IX307_001391 [Bacteroides pyogenes]|nr:hypothetical protein [Bacteroides pyogenes]MBR8740083.1 hypothetical protein [Bacteroides pyogenes]MBR8755837.1 hypothetical protein [Bacteroides pyogenes]MBR8787070.1 hypothetical protein [Bacteroides pyogenes]MBR8792562.1 hypothetical protein [Bacteroides pyogenes]
MSNNFKNTICAFIACISAYLYGVSETNSWYIISNKPSEDVSMISEMLFVLFCAFFICRFFIEIFDLD